MGKLFILVGESASGKDFLMSQILLDCPHIKKLTSYTTRPKRKEEKDGREYFFVTDSFFEEKKREGKIIEERIDERKEGTWRYGTIDENINFVGRSYIAIKDPAGAQKLREYYGRENVVVILVKVEDGLRLMRAVTREMGQPVPNYEELCRRFLKDKKDFEFIEPDFVIENKAAIDSVQQLKDIMKKKRKD